jgi:hypothetical protein
MTWQQALDEIVSRTRHERYRELCADDWPGHEAWRAEMLRLAGEPPTLPPLPDNPTPAPGVRLGGCCG